VLNRRMQPRASFWLKPVAAGGLVVMADLFFFGRGVGVTGGVFALVWLGLTLALRPAIFRDARARIAAAAAALCAATLLDRFTLVGWVLFWTALTTAALSPRTGRLSHAGAWGRRVAAHALLSLGTPFDDVGRVKRLHLRPGMVMSLSLGAILPVGGGLLFLALFARANPLIASALEMIRLPDINFVLFVRAGF
jgi:hypothetical protein